MGNNNEILEYSVVELLRVSPELSIRHKTTYGRKDSIGRRQDYIREYTYSSDKYTDCCELSMFAMNREDYLMLDFTPVRNKKSQVLASYHHIFKIKSLFKEAARWFVSDKYLDAFIVEDNMLKVNTERKLSYTVSGLVQGASLRVEPEVIISGDIVYEGIKLYFFTEKNFILLTSDEVLAVHDLLSTFDLYTSSLTLGLYGF